MTPTSHPPVLLLLLPPTIQFAKQQQLEGEVAVLRGAVEAARSEYYKASEQNASDLAALRRDMSRDMVDMLREFALVQVGVCLAGGRREGADEEGKEEGTERGSGACAGIWWTC